MVVVGVFLVSAFISVQLWGILYQQARARTLYHATASGDEIRLGILLFALAFAVAPALAVGLWSMFVTHRICGPIRVMENYLEQLALGRFPKRRSLRKKDEFKEFYDVLWHAIYSLEERKRSDLAALGEVLRTARSAAAEDDDA